MLGQGSFRSCEWPEEHGGYICWSRDHPGGRSGLRSMESICARAENVKELRVY